MAARKPGRKLRVPRAALEELRASHPGLADVMDRVPFDMRVGYSACDLEALVRSIVGQQLSGKAAATIYGRFRGLYDEDGFPEAEEILGTHHAKLRKVGLSRQKMAAIRDLCRHVCDGALPLDDPELARLSDEQVIERLTCVRGVGRWSAQMFLMFHLGRKNVWPTGDLGIQKGAQQVLGLRDLPKPKQLEPHGDQWRPYRSVAAWYLWRSLE